MKKLEYIVQFLTPAFLGNAEQTAQWRTPPFKTLLRQWWRVLNANLTTAEMLKKENEAFGAALNDTGLQSSVRVRLSNWSAGKMKDWPNDSQIPHPEVKDKNTGKVKNIGAHMYLAYGPLEYRQGTKLKKNAAIQENESAEFSIVVDDKKIPNLDAQLADVMQLAHWFGTLGGRSRNGWGSAQFKSKSEKLMSFEEMPKSALVEKITMPLNDCLNFDYPSALGKDDSGRLLVWQAKAECKSWEEAMKELAKIKIALRTHFSLVGHSKSRPMLERHVLSYPVTNHETSDYDKSARLPNQLRFKVHKTSDGKYLPVAFHFPVKTPKNVFNRGQEVYSKSQQLAVWQQAHKKMDELMMRIG